MNIIFLDIDGVLNRHEYIGASQSPTFNKRCIFNFNKLLLYCNNVVLVSAWRYMILRCDMSSIGFTHMLRTHGVYYKINIVDTTRADSKISISDRCTQIKEWIDNRYDEVNYVVLDDLGGLYQDEEVRKRLVVTNANLGLTAKDVKRAIKILEG